jgi:thymidylate synthase
MKNYLDALRYILDNGEIRKNRTGIDTIGVFGMQQRYDLRKGFPAITTKKLAWKAVVSELRWFLKGSSDERELCEMLHGTRDEEKKTIWTDNANAPYWKPKARYKGDAGRIYGVQWRHWLTRQKQYISSSVWEYVEIDQIKNLIDSIKKDPFGRRHIISAWNPAELDQMALPPCHVMAQFYVNSKNELSCQMYQRSADMPLGVPFNIASYSLLTHMIAQVCGLGVGEFIHTVGDAHIYLNQIDAVKEQLARQPLPLPTLWLNPNIKNIDSFKMDDCKLINYQHHEPIQIPFSV